MSVRMIPYLMMDGNAREAVDFYLKALDGELIFMQTYGEGPQNPEFPLPEEAKNLILHADIKVGDAELMLSDNFPGSPHQKGNQVTICISTEDKEKAQRFYDALSQDGNVVMPLQETFFSPAYGIVTDKFGVTFQIHTQGQM